MTLYPIASWRTALKYKYGDGKPRKAPSPIVDKYIEYDDGKNCHGYVAYKFPEGKIKKFYFTYQCNKKIVKLFQDVKTEPYGIYRRYSINNIIVEREVYVLLNREDVISQSELKKIFLRFD